MGPDTREWVCPYCGHRSVLSGVCLTCHRAVMIEQKEESK